MPLYQAKSDVKQQLNVKKSKDLFVSDEAQNRLWMVQAPAGEGGLSTTVPPRPRPLPDAGGQW